MNILLLDNYDSFTYNLFQLLSELGATVEVVRNDAISVDQIRQRQPHGILISPGPGIPEAAKVSLDSVKELGGEFPILGVCLGLQCVARAYGASVVRAPELMHGKSSMVYHDGSGVFTDLPNPFEAIRYHSLAVDPTSVPDCLEVTGRTESGTIMGLRHKHLNVQGVQFHPESIMTPSGVDLMRNWLNVLEREPRARQSG